MELLIAGGIIFALIAARHIAGLKGKKPSRVRVCIPRKEIKQIDLLLHNIEVYNGTAKGQKRMEVK